MGQMNIEGTLNSSSLKINDNDVMSNFAPAYDNTATYAVGDLCTYQGKVYQCSSAIETAEDFDNTKWTGIDVSTLLSLAGGTKLYRHDITFTINLPYPLSATLYIRLNNYISKEQLDTKAKFLAQMCSNSVQFDYACNDTSYAPFMILSIRLRSDESNYCLIHYLEINSDTGQVTALKSVNVSNYVYSATITEL